MHIFIYIYIHIYAHTLVTSLVTLSSLAGCANQSNVANEPHVKYLLHSKNHEHLAQLNLPRRQKQRHKRKVRRLFDRRRHQNPNQLICLRIYGLQMRQIWRQEAGERKQENNVAMRKPDHAGGGTPRKTGEDRRKTGRGERRKSDFFYSCPLPSPRLRLPRKLRNYGLLSPRTLGA